MTLDLAPEALLLALLLFSMRVINYAISTLRLVFIARGMKLLSAVAAFIEAFIFAVVMASVVTDLGNVANLIAYCMGAAVGSYTGMFLESRFITSYSTVNIITQKEAKPLAEHLRQCGYGVTVTQGEGREGMVYILRSSTVNRDIPRLLQLVQDKDASAFVQVDSARVVRRGWIPGAMPGRV